MMEGRVGVAIMARAPIAGEAKTRLIPALGAEGAARLQAWLLQRTVAMALVADVGPVNLWCAGNAAHPDFALCRAFGAVGLHRQIEGGLGARMFDAMENSCTAAGAIVIGTDCPALGPSQLRDAAAALRDNDAVAIPVEDGGYALLGMKRPAREPFADIQWSSAGVMAQTRQRFAALGWCWAEPHTLWDVDRPEDLLRLYAHCTETRAIFGDTDGLR